MDYRYFLTYTQANVFCILIFVLLLANDLLHSARQEKQLWFNRTIGVHIFYFLCDIGWAAALAGLIEDRQTFALFFNFSSYVLLSLIAYEWFMYMAASENMNMMATAGKRWICRLPVMLSAVGFVVFYLLFPSFRSDGETPPGTLYYLLMVTVPMIYILSSFILSLINAGRTENRQDRHLYLLIGVYPLGVVLFGLLQTFAVQAPLFCCGCTLMMLTFYIQNMQTQVSLDPLTRLSNRGQIDRYMHQLRNRENQKVFVMMVDVDHFKEINDTFGHTEGDRALNLVAESLRQAVEQIREPVFIGRYGGDEFTLFLQTGEGRKYVDQLVLSIRYSLREKSVSNRLPYDLSISIGYEELGDQGDSVKACLERADEKLYQEKRKME